MPYPATLIAYAFVKRGIQEGAPVTQMKLQKMVYFAHGLHLALYKTALVRDQVQAWKYGPVLPLIYQAYKHYGSLPISGTDLILLGDEPNELSKLDENAKKTIDYTWSALKDTNVIKLTNWTHIDGSPWKDNYIEGINEIEIPNDVIQKYFETFLVK